VHRARCLRLRFAALVRSKLVPLPSRNPARTRTKRSRPDQCAFGDCTFGAEVRGQLGARSGQGSTSRAPLPSPLRPRRPQGPGTRRRPRRRCRRQVPRRRQPRRGRGRRGQFWSERAPAQDFRQSRARVSHHHLQRNCRCRATSLVIPVALASPTLAAAATAARPGCQAVVLRPKRRLAPALRLQAG